MSDWPTPNANDLFGGTITIYSPCCHWRQSNPRGSNSAAAVWPAANKAIYIAFTVETTVTAYQMAVIVTTQSGNLDVGIYNINAVRVISKGSTAVAAAGVQLVDITDTVLTPGVYFMAMCVDNTTAAFQRVGGPEIQSLRASGVQEQAVGAVTLPDPATFANPAAAYVPFLSIATKATI